MREWGDQKIKVGVELICSSLKAHKHTLTFTNTYTSKHIYANIRRAHTYKRMYMQESKILVWDFVFTSLFKKIGLNFQLNVQLQIPIDQ